MKQAGRIRRLLVPAGSRREKFVWIAGLAIRKLGDGPVPWFRAVRRGLFDALPEGVKGRIARRRLGMAPSEQMKLAFLGKTPLEIEGRISVVLPVFNQASMLRESIESVLAQTHPDFELIVVNDGSTDEIDEVFEDYEAHPRVRLLTQPNLKLPHALSNGFDFARGSYLTWTSADNLMEPDQLERLAAFLDSHEEPAMVFADYLVIDGDGAPLQGSDFRPQNRKSPSSAEIHLPRNTDALNVLQDNFIGPCFLYRAVVRRCLGDYSPKLGVEDYDYWMRVNSEFRISHLGSDELLYRYRWHDNSLNARARELKLFELGQALMQHERERHEWRSLPWEEHLAPQKSPQTQPTKQLLHLSPEAAMHTNPTKGQCIAIDWASDWQAPYRYPSLFRRDKILSHSSSAETIAALALFTNRAHHLSNDEAGSRILRAAATETTHYIDHTEEELRKRPLPSPWYSKTQPRKLLFQAEDFTQGGLECVVLDLIPGLQARGFDPSLLVLGTQGIDAKALEQVGVQVLTTGTRTPEAYEALLEQHKIDIVHAHHSVFGASSAKALGIPFVQTLHNCYVWLSPEEILDWRAQDEATSAYLCVSAQVALYAHARLGLDIEKTLILPNGIDTQRSSGTGRSREALRKTLGLTEDAFVFLNVASIYPPKAQRLIARALARSRESASELDIKVVTLGRSMNASYENALNSDIEDLGLTDSYLLPGYDQDPASYYQMADAFLLPSLWEGCSLAVEEALCAGLPAVLSDVGAAREQLENGKGEIVAPPFASITELDSTVLPRHLSALPEDYCSRIADAMLRVARQGKSRTDPARANAAFSQELVSKRHADVFHWLLQGGDAAAARPFTWTP